MAKGRSPEFYPVNSRLGERHSTKPLKFKPLRAVGINPRLRGINQEAGTPRTWGENGGKCPGERWVRTFLRPRVHIGIHMSTPFPQKALQGPGPAQGNWGTNLGTCPQ